MDQAQNMKKTLRENKVKNSFKKNLDVFLNFLIVRAEREQFNLEFHFKTQIWPDNFLENNSGFVLSLVQL